jgi:hypothetical protein
MAACGGRRRKAARRRSAQHFPSAALGQHGEPPLSAISGRRSRGRAPLLNGRYAAHTRRRRSLNQKGWALKEAGSRLRSRKPLLIEK